MKLPTTRAIPALVLLTSSFAIAPAHATGDWKFVDGTSCQPYGPGTTSAELTYNQLGITNPGTTNESVMCPLPTDSESQWSTTPGVTAHVLVYFRSGAVPGRVACTAFVSKASMTAGAVFTLTANPANSLANSLGTLSMNLADINGGWGVGPPAVLLCTLTPKATLGGMYLLEQASTNTP